MKGVAEVFFDGRKHQDGTALLRKRQSMLTPLKQAANKSN